MLWAGHCINRIIYSSFSDSTNHQVNDIESTYDLQIVVHVYLRQKHNLKLNL